MLRKFYFNIDLYIVYFLCVWLGGGGEREDEIPQLRSFARVNLLRNIARQVNFGRYANIGKRSIINPTFIGLGETSSFLSFQLFSFFSLVTFRIVNLRKRTEADLLPKSGLAVLAVHS